MSLFAAVLGLGIYHALMRDEASPCCCYAGVYNPAGAEPPQGIQPLGDGATPGVAHVRLEYDEQGRLRRMMSVGADGRLCALPGSQVAEQRVFYDDAGHMSRRENYDAAGVAVEDAQGVSVREFEHDAAGRHTITRFRDAAGHLVAPRFPGYAECRTCYDEQNRPLRVLHLGVDGKPVADAAGEMQIEYRYGADGSITRRNLVNGKAADNAYGVAQEIYRLGENGSTRSWQNAVGEPVLHPLVGAAHLKHEPQAAPGVERRRFLGVDGSPVEHCRTCAEHLVRCNSRGLPEWECYGGCDGLPVNHPGLGYAERVCIYSATGSLSREYFWDAAGNPAATCERRYVDTPAGDYTLSLHSNGSTTVQPG